MHLKTKIIAATPMITIIVYLLLGFCANAWHPGWIVFFAIPLVPMILGIDSLAGLYPLVTVIAYLIMGFVWNLWHPGWIIFLTIPVVEIFLPKRKHKSKKKHNFKKIFSYDESDEIED
ncbi:MAG: hypothetical protein K2I42_05840 [Anaeroplasmataceae bacterium]|nr:hypothetical protein [Anaeroplasmataceae bacterium]